MITPITRRVARGAGRDPWRTRKQAGLRTIKRFADLPVSPKNECRYEVLDRAHTGLESDSSPIGYGPHPSRFNQSHPPYKGRAPSQNENCWRTTPKMNS